MRCREIGAAVGSSSIFNSPGDRAGAARSQVRRIKRSLVTVERSGGELAFPIRRRTQRPYSGAPKTLGSRAAIPRGLSRKIALDGVELWTPHSSFIRKNPHTKRPSMIASARAASTSNCASPLRRGSAVLSEKSCSVRNGWMAGAIAGLKEFGPYAAIELVLPGGSLIAILLWLHRRRQFRRNLAQGATSRNSFFQIWLQLKSRFSDVGRLPRTSSRQSWERS
jgi:hypothetical protein